ncbi:MAG: hypothetical protein ACTSV9_04030 [Candidatus Thorarchaeota archaeon]
MFREEFSEQGKAEDQNIALWKLDYVVFLLGSGFPPKALEIRKKAGKALKDRGYNILVMEELDGAPTEGDSKELANEKFRRILKNYRPDLFLILVSQNLPAASGVAYEIATLVERYGIKKASGMIRMCAKKGVDMNQVYPAYVRELKEIVIREYNDDFDDMLSILENTIIDSMTQHHGES